MRNALERIEPRVLALHVFLLALFGLGLAWQERGRLRADLRFATAAGLIALAGVGAAAYLAPDTHRLYFDEDIYIQIAQSMAYDGRSGMLDCSLPNPAGDPPWHGTWYSLNKEPSGYPFLVSLVVRATGLMDRAGRVTSLLFFGLGIFALALLARRLFGSTAAGLLVAVAYAFWPENLRWAVTASAEITAASLAIASLWLALRVDRRAPGLDALVALLAVTLAVQQRPEGVLLLAPFWLLIGDAGGGYLRGWRAKIVYLAAMLLLLLPHGLHLIAMSGEDWGAVNGPKFSVEHARANLPVNLGYWYKAGSTRFNTEAPPLGMAWFFLLGVAVSAARLWRERHDVETRRAIAAVALWLLLFFGVFVPFYAGSYYYGVDVRFSLLVVAPFLIFAVSGLYAAARRLARGRERGAVALCALVLIAVYARPLERVPWLSEEAWQARADHAAVAAMAGRLPADAVVVSHTPSMWADHGRAGVQLVWALEHPRRMERLRRLFPLYYHYNFWDIAGTGRPNASTVADGARFLSRYDAVEVDRVASRDPWVFRLYRLERWRSDTTGR